MSRRSRWFIKGSLSLSLSLSLRFNGHFPGEPGLAGVYWSKGWWRWWRQLDYTGAVSRAKLQSPPTNEHPVFYRPDALPVAQPTVSKHWREKYHIPWTCLLVMGRCRYLTSVSVFGIFVGIFSSRFGIRYRYFKILRYRFGISVFQLVHFKGHG